jgi:hypothetical protein
MTGVAGHAYWKVQLAELPAAQRLRALAALSQQ